MMKKITLLFCLFAAFGWGQGSGSDLTVTVDASDLDMTGGGMNLVHNFQNPGFVEVAATDNTDGTYSFTFTGVPTGVQIEYVWKAYNGANPQGLQENLVPIIIDRGIENDIAIGEPKNTNFFDFCNRIAAAGSTPAIYFFNSFRKPGVVYAETTVTGTAGEFHYIRWSVNGFALAGGPGAVDNGDGTHTVRTRPISAFEYLWNNQATATEESLLTCINGGAAGPVNTDNFSYANRVHIAGVNDRDEFNVCPEDETFSNKEFDITSFKSYPNPTNDNWKIQSKDINITLINIYDVLGKNVLTVSPNSSEVVIDGSSLKSGLYFAKINSISGSQTIKLVKN